MQIKVFFTTKAVLDLFLNKFSIKNSVKYLMSKTEVFTKVIFF